MIVVLFTANMALSQSNSEYKAKIESINKEMAKNMLEGNTEKLLSLYTEDAISMPNMDKPMEDHGKYLTIWEKQKDGSLKMKVETWNSDVDPMSMMK